MGGGGGGKFGITANIRILDHLRCFDTVFLGPYLTFLIGS